jgi:hypothetical protein
VRSTAAPYTESRLTRSVANERVGFPVVEHILYIKKIQYITKRAAQLKRKPLHNFCEGSFLLAIYCYNLRDSNKEKLCTVLT